MSEWLAAPPAAAQQFKDPVRTVMPPHLAAVACLVIAAFDWEVRCPRNACRSLRADRALGGSDVTGNLGEGQPQLLPGVKDHLGDKVRDAFRSLIQVKLVCGRSAFEHKEEAIPPTSTLADTPDRGARGGLRIRPGLRGQPCAAHRQQ